MFQIFLRVKIVRVEWVILNIGINFLLALTKALEISPITLFVHYQA